MLAIGTLAAGAAAYATVSVTSSNGDVSGSITPSGAHSAPTIGGTVAPAGRVSAQVYAAAPVPTAAERKALEEAFDEPVAPAPNRVTVNPDTRPGAQAAPATGPAVDTDYKRFLVRNLPTGSIVGGSGYSSYVNEPSVGAAGRYLFMTGNWRTRRARA